MTPEARTVAYVDITGRGGGSNMSLRILLDALDRQRYRPVLVFGDLNNAERWKNERVFEFNFASFDNFDFFLASWDVRWIYQLLRFLVHLPVDFVRSLVLLRKLRPTAVHVNCGQAVTFGIAAKTLKYPIVWHVRELVGQNLFGKLQDRLYSICADRIVVPSWAVASRLPVSRKKIVLIRNAVSAGKVSRDDVLHFKREHGIEHDEFVILLLAHAVAITKGYLFLADVAEQLADKPKIKFVLAGHFLDQKASAFHNLLKTIYRTAKGHSGEKRKILDRWEPLVRTGKAVFPGYVDAKLAIEASAVVVCPTRTHEPFGRTVIEAYSQAKPVIASAVPAFTELIEHGSTGWLVETSVSDWVRTISMVYNDPEQLSRVGHRAKLKSMQYLPEEHAEQIMNLYETILTSRH